jgi:DNA modification methylase
MERAIRVYSKDWPTSPGVVCDIFNGVGTTCVAAKALGRRWIGIDISEAYCEASRKRLAETQAPLLVSE